MQENNALKSGCYGIKCQHFMHNDSCGVSPGKQRFGFPKLRIMVVFEKSDDEHGITICVEPVFVLNCFFVSIHDQFIASKSTHHNQ